MKLKTETAIELFVSTGRVCIYKSGDRMYIRLRARGLTQTEADRLVKVFGGKAYHGVGMWRWYANSVKDIARVCSLVKRYQRNLTDHCGAPTGREDIDHAANILHYVEAYTSAPRGQRTIVAQRIVAQFDGVRSIFLGGYSCIPNKCR